MPAPSMQYMLAGFSKDLDWRPLHFVKPLPPNRVCSACGLVRPKAALLPCAHTLCECCYDQCVEESLPVCPLDGNECHNEEVICINFPADDLLKREIKCWNEETGCTHVAAAWQIAEHYERDCRHHSVRCPKCSVTVTCFSLIQHLKKCISNSATPSSSSSVGQSVIENATGFSRFPNAMFEKRVAEVKGILGQIVSDIVTHGDRLDEISHAVNSLKDTQNMQLNEARREVGERRRSCTRIMSKMDDLHKKHKDVLPLRTDALNLSRSINGLEKIVKDGIANVATEIRDKFRECATDIQASRAVQVNKEISEGSVDNTGSMLERTHCLFVVKGIKALQEAVMKWGCALFENTNVYLRGYNLSTGVFLNKDGKLVKLYAWLCLNEGNLDEIVRWPFDHTIRLSVLHPNGERDEVFEVQCDPSSKYVQKPTGGNSTRTYFPQKSLNVDDLIKGGYVQNDEISVMFELIP